MSFEATLKALGISDQATGNGQAVSTFLHENLKMTENPILGQVTKLKPIVAVENTDSWLSTFHTAAVVTAMCNTALHEAASQQPPPMDLPQSFPPVDAQNSTDHINFLGTVLQKGSPALVETLRLSAVSALADVYYAAVHADVCDMFTHLSASELMMLDGDSLIITAMTNAHVDWDLAQSLHVAHLVHRYLEQLVRRGAKVQIVFFKCHEWFFAMAPQMRLVRNIIRKLLLARAQQPGCPFEAFVYDSYTSDTFADHLRRHSPEFIVVNDGEEMHPLQSEEAPIAAKTPFRSVLGSERIGARVATALHRMMVYFIGLRIHVVFSSRQVFKDNDIFVFTLHAHSRNFVPMEALRDDIKTILDKETARMEARTTTMAAAAPVMDDTLAAVFDDFGNNRLAVLGSAIKALLPSASAPAKAIMKAAVITAVCMPFIGHPQRKQPVGANPAYAAVLNDICSGAADIFEKSVTALTGEDYDFLDGHLVAAIAHHLRTTPASALCDADFCADIDVAWKTISGEDDACAAPIPDLPEVVFKDSKAAPAVNLFKHDVVSHIEHSANVAAPASMTGEPIEPVSIESLCGPMVKYLKNWTFNNDFAGYNDVISKEELDEQRKLLEEKHQLRQQEKLDARYIQSVKETATSMGVEPSNVRVRVDTGAAAAAESTAAAADGDAKATKYKGASKKNTGGMSVTDLAKEGNTMKRLKDTVEDRLKSFARYMRKAEEIMGNYTPDRRRLAATVSKELNTLINASSVAHAHESIIEDLPDKADYLVLHAVVAALKEKIPDALDFLQKDGGKDAEKAFASFAKSQAKDAAELDTLQTKIEKDLKKKKQPSEADTKKVEALKAGQAIGQKDEKVADLVARRALYLQLDLYMRVRAQLRRVELAHCVWKGEKPLWVSELEVAENKEAYLNNRDWSAPVELWEMAHESISYMERNSSGYPLMIPSAKANIVRAAIEDLNIGAQYRVSIIDTALAKVLAVGGFGPVPAEMLCAKSLPPSDPTQLQLLRMAERFPRSVPETRDGRVRFNPDMWQRELMDVVDARGSVVACAPTSSGKTFIAYYCMESVFGQSVNENTNIDDIGVCVYVAPTRSLINQAVADIYGRYKDKNYGNRPFHVFGALGGRDFVKHPFDCQALVTLPDVLETILLSPHHQKWLKRVRYFIFDEVHTMEGSGNGAVWERLLSMIRAPFVALSATIGETEQLLGWLQRAQTKQVEQAAAEGLAPPHLCKVEVIPRNGAKIARWSDIEKHSFMPLSCAPLDTLRMDINCCDKADIVPFHPLSAVTPEMLLAKQAFPADLSIVPRETLELQQALETHSEAVRTAYGAMPVMLALRDRLLALRPATYFANLRHITQQKAREWETDVKGELLHWVKMSTKAGCASLNLDLRPLVEENDVLAFTGTMLAAVTNVLGSFKTRVLEREVILHSEAAKGKIPFPDTIEFVRLNVVRLLYTLTQRNMTPAIVFVLDQEECEALAEVVVTALEEAEDAFRSTPDFLAYAARMERDREENDKRKRSAEIAKRDKKKHEKGEDGSVVETEHEEIAVRPDADFDIPDVLPEFRFATNQTADEDVMDSLENGYLDRTSVIYRALKRGIGIHHGGVSGKLRGAVERLFRKKVLPFVFATEGLALGIHSPCRAVVLASDSMSLNVAEFRQMSGRAGRRGLDFLGHVVFFGIGFKKIKRLLTSDLVNLRGHNQTDATTALRLLELYSHRPPTENKEHLKQWSRTVLNTADLIYVDPLFLIGRVQTNGAYASRKAALLRFQLSMFESAGLVSTATESSALGNLLLVMLNIRNNVRAEAAAFLLTRMLQEGSIANAALIGDGYSQLALLLAYVLSRHNRTHMVLELPRAVLRDPLATYLHANEAKQHAVYLPTAIASQAKHTIDAWSKTVLGAASAYLATEAAKLPDSELTLPFQLTKDDGSHASTIAAAGDDLVEGLSAALGTTATSSRARHPFVALCGKGDTFDGVEDAQHSLRDGLFLDPTDLPTTDLYDLGRHDGSPVVVNACFYDYVRCGSQREKKNFKRLHLLHYNRLSQGASWATLNEAFTGLSNLTMGIKQLTSSQTDPVASAVKKIADRCADLRGQLDNRHFKSLLSMN